MAGIEDDVALVLRRRAEQPEELPLPRFGKNKIKATIQHQSRQGDAWRIVDLRDFRGDVGCPNARADQDTRLQSAFNRGKNEAQRTTQADPNVVYIRLKLEESPIFEKMKAEGRASQRPIAEAFGRWDNVKRMLILLFGITTGMTVIWYTAQFYCLFFLQTVLQVDYQTTYLIFTVGLILGTPLIVLFGALSDRMGRKWIMITGLVLAALTLMPSFRALARFTKPALIAFSESTPIMIAGDAGTFSIFAKPSSDAEVYGPMAAFMVELFPARIRSTSLSLPYHLGVGILGGFLPFVASALTVYHGNIFAGLWYPVIIAGVTAIVGWIILPETKDGDIG